MVTQYQKENKFCWENEGKKMAVEEALVLAIALHKYLLIEQMDGWMHACMDGWMDEWMDRWMNGWMDGWMGVRVDE